MANFYVIFIQPKDGITRSDIEKKMDLALDWFRLTGEVWILYTTGNASTWYTRLGPIVKPEGSLFICKLNIEDRNGWVTKELWSWIRKNNAP